MQEKGRPRTSFHSPELLFFLLAAHLVQDGTEDLLEFGCFLHEFRMHLLPLLIQIAAEQVQPVARLPRLAATVGDVEEESLPARRDVRLQVGRPYLARGARKPAAVAHAREGFWGATHERAHVVGELAGALRKVALCGTVALLCCAGGVGRSGGCGDHALTVRRGRERKKTLEKSSESMLCFLFI